MTREELKQHCLKQVAYCEEMMKLKSEYVMLPSNHSKIYQEHKLILELLEESEKKAYRKNRIDTILNAQGTGCANIRMPKSI